MGQGGLTALWPSWGVGSRHTCWRPLQYWNTDQVGRLVCRRQLFVFNWTQNYQGPGVSDGVTIRPSEAQWLFMAVDSHHTLYYPAHTAMVDCECTHYLRPQWCRLCLEDNATKCAHHQCQFRHKIMETQQGTTIQNECFGVQNWCCQNLHGSDDTTEWEKYGENVKHILSGILTTSAF